MDEDKINSGESEKFEVITYSKPVDEPKVGTLRMVMRLALGGAIIGREELKRRFQEAQSDPVVSPATLNRETPIETEADRARYAAIGAIAKSSDGLRSRISTLSRVANRSYGKITRALDPVTNSRVMSPFRRRYQRYTDHGDKIISEWVAAGRREEYLSRQLAKETTTEAIEETLDYLAESPELDELMQQQSVDLVEDIFEDIGDGATNTTLILSDWFSSTILRRPRRRKKGTTEPQSGDND
jgi:hypothetical protein